MEIFLVILFIVLYLGFALGTLLYLTKDMSEEELQCFLATYSPYDEVIYPMPPIVTKDKNP